MPDALGWLVEVTMGSDAARQALDRHGARRSGFGVLSSRF